MKTMKKVLLIINPNSGRGLGRYCLPKIEGFFKKRNVQLDTFQTKRPKDATMKAAKSKDSYDIIIAAGGDGTINEVVNGMAGGNASLAIIPLGTANVLASQFSIPDDLEQAVQLIFDKKPRPVDLGMVNNHCFLQSCGIGFDAQVISSINTRFKQQTGKFLFYLNIIKTLFSYRPPRLRITIDKKRIAGYTAVVMNSKYYGGRLVIAKDAKMNDGLLDIIVFEKPSPLLMFQVVFSGILFRKLLDFDDISIYRGKTMRIDSTQGRCYVQTDGELIGSTPADITVLPRMLKIIC